MSEKGVAQVLIATVGGTPEPILTAALEHAPERAIFIASQGTQQVVAQVLGVLGTGFQSYTILLDDAESLSESYDAAKRALEKALEWEARSITADLTGGTKPMVAGLALALSGQGVTLSYVGGTVRDAFGRVESGSEQVRVLEDPTARYFVREWEALTRAWNGGRFREVQSLIALVQSQPLSASSVRFFGHLNGVCKGLEAWDSFRHAEAAELLAAHLEPALSIAEAWRHGAKVRVLGELVAQQGKLEAIQNSTLPTRVLLEDLLANAKRRAGAGRFDDALARLYRAVELAAEVDIAERHGFSLNLPSSWPTTLSPELRRRAGTTLGLKETLDLAFDIDVFFGKNGTLAQRLRGDYQVELRALLSRRHESILAHGLKAVGRGDYEALRVYLAARGLRAWSEWPRW